MERPCNSRFIVADEDFTLITFREETLIIETCIFELHGAAAGNVLFLRANPILVNTGGIGPRP